MANKRSRRYGIRLDPSKFTPHAKGEYLMYQARTEQNRKSGTSGRGRAGAVKPSRRKSRRR